MSSDATIRYEHSEHEISTGDVVVDLASGQALQVVSQSAQTVGEHRQTRSDPTAEMFGAEADEPVFNCVFLPDGEKVSPPSKTYAYPASRLLRYPVERATDGKHLQYHLRLAILQELAEAADGGETALFEIVERAYSQDVAETLAEIAAADGGESA